MRRFGLHARFLVTLLGILLPLQALTSLVVLERVRSDALRQAVSALDGGGRIFQRLLEDREVQLLGSVEILASDFGIKRAVGTADRPTIESALENHGRRIDADLAFLVEKAGQVVAQTPRSLQLSTAGAGLARLIDEARARGRASGVVVAAGRPHQIVIAPVRAPLPIGWIAMGFELDAELARDLRDLTDLEVAFWSTDGPERPLYLASTHQRPDQERLARALEQGRLRTGGERPGALHESSWISLPLAVRGGDRGGAEVGVVLRVSRVEVLRAYSVLRADLLRFFALGVALALGGALLTSRRLTRPIALLVEATRQLSSGRFETRLEVDSPDEIGDLARTFRVMQDALADRERKILFHSSHDRLTALPNRGAVAAEVERRLASSEVAPFAVAVLDIDRLKDVNGTLGATIGDQVLTRTAERLRTTDEIEWAARIGGDEFLIVIHTHDALDSHHALDSHDALESSIERVRASLEQPLAVQGVQVEIQVSSGLAVAGEDGSEPETLVRRAEMALALAKERKACHARYEPGVEESNQRRVGILIELERALERDDLELHYQPKVDMRTGRIAGAEALVRWEHPQMGRMNPAEFVSVAEHAGSIGRLSRWVVRAAIAQRERWAQMGFDWPISVNLSADDVTRGDLLELLGEHARSSPSGAALQIEVTESAIMNDPARAAAQLEAVRERGVTVAIDDFGTGHSSLAQLRDLPSDELKIDQSFVRHLRPGTVDEVIVRTTIELGHSLGLRVVAEGIEDRLTFELLARHGCDVGQGYWIGRPMPASEFGEWLDRFEKAGLDD